MTRDPLMPPAGGSDNDIEQRVRVVLHQRAEAIHPQPPAWEELMNRPDGSVMVVPLQVGEERRRRRGHGAWLRPGLAAASVGLIVLTAAVVMENTGSDSSDAAGEPAGQPPAEVPLEDLVVDGLRLPAPGNRDYQPWTSPPLYPAVDLTASVPLQEDTSTEAAGSGDEPVDPVWPWQSAANWREFDELDLLEQPGPLAESYLHEDAAVSNQFDEGLELQIDRPQVAELDSRTVPWSMNDLRPDAVEDKPIQGIVFLQPFEVVDDPQSPQRWAVVGVRTAGLKLQNVRRDGDVLLFTVDRQGDTSGFNDIRVQVNDETLDVGRIGRDQTREFDYPLLEDETATIRLQHMLNGEPISITEMIVPPTRLALDLGSYDLGIETRQAEMESTLGSDRGG